MKKRKLLFIIPLFVFFIIFFLLIYFNFLNSKKYSINVDGLNREYLLHTPTSLEKMPLVIALHGYSDNPRLMEFYSGLSRKADKEKFIVVYPYGTKNENDKNLSWNGGSCCGNGVLNNIDDVSFINTLTDELVKKYNIDSNKIFLVGFSNGALLGYRIASQTPDRYKGLAIVSGSIGGKVYKKLPAYQIPTAKKPISVVMIHGVLDDRIPYLGGENIAKNGSFKSFKESSDFWIINNKCKESTKAEDNVFVFEKYSDCKDDTKIETYIIKDGNHVWPGSIMEIKEMLKRKTIPATDIIWNFFN